MNTNTRATKRIGTALMIAGLAIAGSAGAQQATLKTAAIPSPDVNRQSCERMNWNKDMLGRYPWVVGACHEVVEVNGEKWARFQGKYERRNANGSFRTGFVDRQNKAAGDVILMPAPGQQVLLSGNRVPFSELREGQVLSFYVPEGTFGFAIEPGAKREQFASVVETTETSGTASSGTLEPTPTPAPVVDSSSLAMADPAPSRSDDTLPQTAGPLPLIALGGLVSMLGALGLGLRRRSSNRLR